MTRQYRQGDSPCIGRIRRSTVPSNGAGVGSRAVRDRGSGRNNTDGNSLTREPLKREPGATLEMLFRQNPDLKRGPFLAYVEQKFRLLGDMEGLREIRAYRAKHCL